MTKFPFLECMSSTGYVLFGTINYVFTALLLHTVSLCC